MENGWITGILILVIGYYLFSLYSRRKSLNQAVYQDILHKEEYKPKGQWEK